MFTLVGGKIIGSLLEAANAEPNKIEVTDQLPTRVGDVSIMTIGELFNALEDCNKGNVNRSWSRSDPTEGYDTSTYYVYGISGKSGLNSTVSNLQAVGLDWYKQLNKPTPEQITFTSNGKTIFGGPFDEVGKWDFQWSCNADCYGPSSYKNCWDDNVASSVYVAVVRARE